MIQELKTLEVKQVDHVLDKEWVALMLEAKKMGLKVEEVQAFFKNNRKK